MRLRPPTSLSEFRDRLVAALSGPQMLAFVPAICLAGYWVGGEATLVAVALLIPMLWMVLGGLDNLVKGRVARLSTSGLVEPDTFRERVRAVRDDVIGSDRFSAVFVLELDDFSTLTGRFERAALFVYSKRWGMVSAMSNVTQMSSAGSAIAGLQSALPR